MLFFIFSGLTFSQSKGFGLGAILGEPTGISAKYWTSGATAFDFGLGYSFTNNSNLHLHADYLFHTNDLINTTENISFYYGPGARLKFDDDMRLGVRFDAGLVWIPRGTSVDVFVEVVPILDIIPETDFSFNAALGVRYFFN
jgi:hypothetical protein